jgi:hypothetical protein
LDTRIRVDTDLLAKTAGEFHQYSGDLKASCEKLLSEIARLTARSEYASLQANASADGFISRELSDKSVRELSDEADTLLALSRAFREIDDMWMLFMEGIAGEGWWLKEYLPAYPDIDNFEPFFVPETRMALDDWVWVYVMGPNGLTERKVTGPDGKEHSQFFTTAEIIGNIVGIWTDPKTKKQYYVVDLGKGEFVYIPVEKLGPPVDFTKIPNRDGEFTNGLKIVNPDLPPPYGSGDWPPGCETWHDEGTPWQNLILGAMNIIGLDGKRIRRMTAHPNLCGPLSVLFALGEADIRGGLSKFAQLTNLGYYDKVTKEWIPYTGTDVLYRGVGTNGDDLIKFIREFEGWHADSSTGTMPTPEELAEMLASGRKLIFLTELDTNHKIWTTSPPSNNPTYGQIVPGAPAGTAGRAAHWVAVTDVFQDSTGEVYVKIFNTYSGCEEVYTWDVFVKSCEQPGREEGKYTYVEAWKE